MNKLKTLLKMKMVLKQVQSPLTIMNNYDLDTYNRDRAAPYCTCIYKVCKFSGTYNRDISEKEYQNCLNDFVVFKGSDCINDMLDHILSFKGETK